MRVRLSRHMTVRQFDHGYWYATEIKSFAQSLRIRSAHKMRKDELEKAIRHFLIHGKVTRPTKRDLSRSGTKDVDRGLRLDLPVVLYTNDRETKSFLEREALKVDPAFKRRSGSRYRLNRWRDAQLTRGKRITYRDVMKEVPRRLTSERRLAVKAMDSAKDYRAFARTRMISSAR